MAGKVIEYKKVSENGITWWERQATCGKVSVTFTRLGGKPNIYFDKYATSKFQSKYVIFGESEDRVYFKESTEKVGTRICVGENGTSQMSPTVESTELFKQIAGRKTLMYDFDIDAFYVEKNEPEQKHSAGRHEQVLHLWHYSEPAHARDLFWKRRQEEIN